MLYEVITEQYMNHIKVKTKMIILMVCVIFLVVFSGILSSINMKNIQSEALTKLEASVRKDYDSNIKA